MRITSAVRADYYPCTPADIAVGQASGLLHVQRIDYAGQSVTIYTPGTRYGRFVGERRTAPVPQRALELALLLELAVARTEHSSDARVCQRRHALVIGGGDHQGAAHMVRVEPPDPKSVRRALHDLLGGPHHDTRLGPRNDYSDGMARHVTVYVPARYVQRLSSHLAPQLARGGLSLGPLTLAEWPPR